MNLIVSNRVLKDARRLPQSVRQQLAEVLELIQEAPTFANIPHLKPLTGHPHYYRIRLGGYRLGLYWNGNAFTVEEIDTRGDFYKKYPPR